MLRVDLQSCIQRLFRVSQADILRLRRAQQCVTQRGLRPLREGGLRQREELLRHVARHPIPDMFVEPIIAGGIATRRLQKRHRERWLALPKQHVRLGHEELRSAGVLRQPLQMPLH